MDLDTFSSSAPKKEDEKPMWCPGASLESIRSRAKLLKTIRQYFDKASVLEVDTPILSRFATVDPYIESFVTHLSYLDSSESTPYYLCTSPEFPMKRLLAAGIGDIYSMGHVFRQGESGSRHNPEFTLLEWYRMGLDHHQLMRDVNQLLKTVFTVFSKSYGDPNFISYQAIFEQHCGFNPHTISKSDLFEQLALKVSCKIDDLTKNDCLDLLFSKVIEPHLGVSESDQITPTFIYDFPVSMSALSRVIDSSSQNQVAARFEVFINGFELANGYWELTDPVEQTKRFQQDQATRQQLNKKTVPYDEYLIDSLNHLSDCAGVALGVDRLHLLLMSYLDIREVIAFNINQA